MIRKPLHIAVIVLAAPLLFGVSQADAKIKKKDVGAALVGGVIGLAVGAALSDAAKHDKVVYYPEYQPPYPPGAYDPYWGRSFKPAPNIICYDAQRACYNLNGAYNNKWTWQVYGR